MRAWFVHGQWPRLFVRTHWFALFSFVLLLITGLMLFLPQVHTALIPILPLLYDLHITFGILLTLALLLPLLARLPQGKKVRRLDWALTQTLLAALAMTGVALWLIAFFPATWRALAFTLHGDFAYVLAGWIVIHMLLRAFSVGKGGGAISQRVLWERRSFIKWSGLGLLGSLAWLAVGGLPISRGKSSIQTPEAIGKLPRAIPPFPEYYTVTGGYPDISEAAFRLSIGGLVEHPQTLTLADIKRLPAMRIARNFQCVTGWVVPDLVWTGVSMKEVVKRAGVHPDAKYVTLYSADGLYTESLSLAQLTADMLLAYEINGEPLPTQQGYPLRLFVPEMFGYKSIKWVHRLQFVKEREVGYWEHYGYPTDAYF